MPRPLPTPEEMETYRRAKDAMGYPLARFGLPINGLDNFEAPLASEDWNGFPVPLVGYDYAKQIAEAVGDPIPAPYFGLRPYDGLCWQVAAICPQCGGDMELVPASEGVINEPCLNARMEIVRLSRPASFLACTACEHCEEVSRG